MAVWASKKGTKGQLLLTIIDLNWLNNINITEHEQIKIKPVYLLEAADGVLTPILPLQWTLCCWSSCSVNRATTVPRSQRPYYSLTTTSVQGQSNRSIRSRTSPLRRDQSSTSSWARTIPMFSVSSRKTSERGYWTTSSNQIGTLYSLVSVNSTLTVWGKLYSKSMIIKFGSTRKSTETPTELTN